MKTPRPLLRLLLISSAAFAWAAGSVAADPPSLNPHLEPLRPLLEKTWRGVFAGGDPAEPVVDVMHWGMAMNGQAVWVVFR